MDLSQLLNASATLKPNAQSSFRLQLNEEQDINEFLVRIEYPGDYALFTQHYPNEFSMKLLEPKSQAEQTPLSSTSYPHTQQHDHTIMSIGIECEGVVKSILFNLWVGMFLKE